MSITALARGVHRTKRQSGAIGGALVNGRRPTIPAWLERVEQHAVGWHDLLGDAATHSAAVETPLSAGSAARNGRERRRQTYAEARYSRRS